MKDRFLLFSKSVHKALIKEGYHAVKVTSIAKRGLTGYVIEVDRYKNEDENGNWVYKYHEQEIIKYHWYPTDPNDPETIAFNNQQPTARPKATTGLTGKAKRKAENLNKARYGWIERSPDVKITDLDVEYPLTDDKVKEMYQSKDIKFYLCINVGYNKGGYRKTKFQLYKRLLAAGSKQLRLLRSG